ncbi:MAG TPA: bifunctional acetate--CoA ligase family protein/GNAT family N-acetyltransferase [Candidatus Limnocylindrales bacterium]|nr:bifunctional acetate--CoA ligase family protein/GNAT family N-acetyltransferase [Candidatus Limnocylindrales bacterium]
MTTASSNLQVESIGREGLRAAGELQAGEPAVPSGRMNQRSTFECMFAPRSVAVIGATDREASVGRTLLLNLQNPAFRGKVYAVNPKRDQVLGVTSYPNVAAIPDKLDLAVIITPAPTVPALIGECVDSGVRSAVVISAGFKERGAEGTQLEDEIRKQLRRGKMRLIGPNCLGIMNPLSGLNATFAHDMAFPGNVAFLSQSGALETAILDWSLEEKVGFSALVSTGSMLDAGWGDLIDYFGEDPSTQSILLYMESVGDARSFLSAARAVALKKPIIVIKVGRSEAASRAASSHTGALTGSDEVFDAALRRCGVLRVQNIGDLFYMAKTLARQPRPKGPRLTILTNAGGPGVLATDSLIANGSELAPVSDATIKSLSEFLSPHWSHANPIDILGDAGPAEYSRALEIAVRDPNSDGLLAILCPQGMTNPALVAESLKPFAKGTGQPVLASWMGGQLVSAGVAKLNEAGIPTFSYPDTAARAFAYMWRYTYNLRGLYETPSLAEAVDAGDKSADKVAAILEKVRKTGRTLLTEVESKQVLAAYGIPTVDTRLAASESEAVSIARELGFPVVLKIYSETITHKTDVGGVKLNLADPAAVSKAYREIEFAVREKGLASQFQGVTVQPMARLDGYELILGSSVDPQFGPVVLFGSGGQLVEVYRDRALALPPLNATLAERLLEQTKVFKALKGVRGRRPVDLNELKRVLIRFSTLVVEQPWIKEIDINPLLASPDRLLALDARVVLHDPQTPPQNLPRPAIRPYPLQYVGQWNMKSGSPVTIRPIRPEDEPLMVKFHETLSDRSVYLRYFHMENLSARVAHDRLLQKCFIDYDREMALVADYTDPRTGEHSILAVGRLTKNPADSQAEIAVLVSDAWQKQGLGVELVRRLIEFGRDERLSQIIAIIMPENQGMRALADRFGFVVRMGEDPDFLVAALRL